MHRFGFAACCEAVAMPRYDAPDYVGLALVRALPLVIDWAKGRTRGVAQTQQAMYGGVAAASQQAAEP